ncbi:MAG: serine O-acetyltransferase [Actinobacteria bacterium]|nr:serine O-acetyltransferase [Actinomycetota bacterium]
MTLALYHDICRNIERPAGAADVALSLLWSRGVQAIALYRLAHWCHRHGISALSEVLLRMSQLLYTVDIAYQAEIGPGLVLRHPMGVVIGKGCTIGRDVTILNGATLGNRFSGDHDRPDGSPTVGDGVLIGTGAKVVGPVAIGDGCTVGANSVVTRTIPQGAVVAGVPARVVRRGLEAG